MSLGFDISCGFAYFAAMSKKVIIAITIIMSLSFISLLVMQIRNVEAVFDARRMHFEESVSRALNTVAHDLEVDEAARYLAKDTTALINTPDDVVAHADGTTHVVRSSNSTFNNEYFTKRTGSNLQGSARGLTQEQLERFRHQHDLINEVVASMLYTASERDLQDRIDFREMDQRVKSELANNGISLNYHFSVYTSNGQCVYRCADYDAEGAEHTFTQTLFKNDPAPKMGELRIHFPDYGNHVYHSITFLTPSIVFTIILLITFIVTVVLVVRQKKLSQVKNDFINNMTHEFKTPISTISLAAQMLSDEAVAKSPRMLARLSSTINDETKRLRFQVEKVLQLSMYENQKANLHMVELNANELISGVVHTFALKVEKNGGKIVTNLEAQNPMITVDEMHFTNVIFNLMDNAVKYKRADAQLELTVSTWNEPSRLCISIQDNGIGIKREDIKRIFEKFYRVHTGNRHDVKGFGLGLAYVKKIITDHKGSVAAESELGIGTKFIIRLPIQKND